MTDIDNLSLMLVEIDRVQDEVNSRLKLLDIMRGGLRQHDRAISYAAGQIDAYKAVARVLKSKDQKKVEKRIAALKAQMGDLG